jgi:hypothetical protein
MNSQPIYLTSASARAMSASLWGTVNHTYKTTGGKGVYYTSNSGHGGYIIDGNVFTPVQRTKIEQFVKPTMTHVTIKDGKMTGMQNPFSTRSWRYSVMHELIQHPIFVFEEDCDWCIPEKFADIRLIDAYTDCVGHEEAIDECFKSWHCPIMLGEVNLRTFGDELSNLERNFSADSTKLGFDLHLGKDYTIEQIDTVIVRLNELFAESVLGRQIQIRHVREKLETVRRLTLKGEKPIWVMN